MNIAKVVDNFGVLGEWEDRYLYLIDPGNRLPPMTNVLKTEEAKVSGCMSRVWIVPEWLFSMVEHIHSFTWRGT